MLAIPNVNEILENLIKQPKYRKLIVKLNQDRLESTGTDVDGKKLKTYKAEGSNVYAIMTMNIKRHAGQENKHVTLKDTGAAYSSMKTETNNTGFAVSMDEDKPDGKISDNLDLESALGIFDITPLTEVLIPDLQKGILNKLLI